MTMRLSQVLKAMRPPRNGVRALAERIRLQKMQPVAMDLMNKAVRDMQDNAIRIINDRNRLLR